jgi:hypothetical protein
MSTSEPTLFPTNNKMVTLYYSAKNSIINSEVSQ